MNDEILVTEEGYQELLNEIETRKSKTRKEISERIKGALKEGDLSENAEYTESKDEQNKNESRIIVLEYQIKHAKILKPNEKLKGTVQIGSKVKVRDIEFDEIEEYSVVGVTEADPIHGKISLISPLGSVLMGKKIGDLVDVSSPGGIVKYEIIELY
ncbi:MAG: transcription elongation factor GreA [Bacillota bacterium]|jgi:transcription elongation factor GreA|nr:transcription elongation factor GreA [Bacillota bacterium]